MSSVESIIFVKKCLFFPYLWVQRPTCHLLDIWFALTSKIYACDLFHFQSHLITTADSIDHFFLLSLAIIEALVDVEVPWNWWYFRQLMMWELPQPTAHFARVTIQPDQHDSKPSPWYALASASLQTIFHKATNFSLNAHNIVSVLCSKPFNSFP